MLSTSCFNNPLVSYFIPETDCEFLKDVYVAVIEEDRSLYLNVSEIVRRHLQVTRNRYFKKPCLVFINSNERYIDGWSFEKGEVVSKGGYKVCRKMAQKPFVTLKQLVDDSRFKERVKIYKKEFELHHELKAHPHISKIFQTYVLFSRKRQMKVKILTFACEYKRGDLFKNRAFVGVLDAFYIIQDITSALKFLHDQKIIYGDMKLENILLANNKAVLTDLGNAGRQGKDTHFRSYTASYASPEMIYGKGADLTTATDLFSWGLTIECLMGVNLLTPYDRMRREGLHSWKEYIIYIEDYRSRLSLSPYANVLRQMLHPDPLARGTIEVLNEHLKKFTNTTP